MRKEQLDLLDYLNKLLQQDAEAKRKAEQIHLEPADDFDDDDDDCDSDCDCDQGPEEDEHGNWTDWREESDDDWEDDDDYEEEPAKLSNIIQNFVNKCAKADRLPTLEEAQTIAILHSIIK